MPVTYRRRAVRDAGLARMRAGRRCGREAGRESRRRKRSRAQRPSPMAAVGPDAPARNRAERRNRMPRPSATSTTTSCCGRRPSSRITGSASTGSAPRWRPPRRRTSSRSSCRSSTISSGRSMRRWTRARQAAYREGVELIHRQMLDLLRKRGVTPIETEGRGLRPEPAPGRRLRGERGPPGGRDHRRASARIHAAESRLLRATMVRVAKA